MKKTPQHHIWHYAILVFAALLILSTAACQSQTAPTQTAPVQKTAVSAAQTEKTKAPADSQNGDKSAENEETDCSYQERTTEAGYQYRAPCNNGYFLIFTSSHFGVYYLALIRATDQWTTLEVDASTIALYGDNPDDLKVMHDQVCYYLKGDPAKNIPSRSPWTNGGEMTQYLKDHPCK